MTDPTTMSPRPTADAWNRHYPVGTPVDAYPGARTEPPLRTRTRTPAWALGHGAPVVAVEGWTGGIALSHVDVISAEDGAR